MERKKIATKARWEPIIGYSRAVRVGSHVFVSGTTGTDSTGAIVAPNDPYAQTIRTIKNIEAALKESGTGLKDVVRTKIYVINIGDWEKIGKAHAELFSDIRPACTMVEISRLIAPEILVEIEADAVIAE